MSDKNRFWKWAPWLVLLCTVTISLRYASSVLKSFRSPFNAGYEPEWIIAWFALAVMALLSAPFGMKALRVWAAAILAIAAAILVLSQSWIAALLAIWIIIVAVLAGESVMKALSIAASGDLDGRTVIAFGIGVTVFTCLVLAIALLHLLTPAMIWALLTAMTLLELRNMPDLLRRILAVWRAWPARSSPDYEFQVLAPLCGCVFLLNLMWAVAPELYFDSLNYHLAVPRDYLAAGGLVDLPHYWHSYFAHLAEMLYTLCMALHDESLAKLMNTAIGAAAGVAVYNLGKLVFTPRVGLWAAAFFYTTPLTNWLSGSAYTDLFTTFFVVSQVIAFLHWRRTRQAGWICATGILMGSAVAVKLNALYAAIGVGMALVALLAASKEQWSKRVATILVCLIAAAVVAFPWYAIVYVETGNPIFPLLNGIFKSPKSSIDNTLMNAADFGVGTTWGALMRLPFRFTLDTTRFGEGLVRGAMGPLMLFLLSFGLLLLPKSSVDVRILWFVSIVFLCLWAFSFQYSRYYMAIMPVTAVLAIAGIHRASLNALTERVHRGALTILLILQVSLTPLLFWNTPERFPINLAFGMESRERFLKRTLYGYAAVLHLNKIVKPGDKVLGSGTDSLRFYVDAPLLSLGETLLNSDARRTFEMPAGPELAQALSSLGVTYIFVADAVELPYTSGEFLKTHASVVYADVEAAVYQLKAPRQE